MPKRHVYTCKQMEDALNAHGGFHYLAARALGCSTKTIENYTRRYPILREIVLQKRGERLDFAEGMLWKKVQEGEAWAICFFLKTQAKERGYTERHEVTGKDGDAVKFIVEVPPKEETADQWLLRYKPDMGNKPTTLQ